MYVRLAQGLINRFGPAVRWQPFQATFDPAQLLSPSQINKTTQIGSCIQVAVKWNQYNLVGKAKIIVNDTELWELSWSEVPKMAAKVSSMQTVLEVTSSLCLNVLNALWPDLLTFPCRNSIDFQLIHLRDPWWWWAKYGFVLVLAKTRHPLLMTCRWQSWFIWRQWRMSAVLETGPWRWCRHCPQIQWREWSEWSDLLRCLGVQGSGAPIRQWLEYSKILWQIWLDLIA